MEKTGYGFRKELSISYQEAIKKVTEALKREGFGVLTEIDVQVVLKRKLNVNFRPYLILGACNPPLAYQSLRAEREIGLLLPCNLIVYQGDTGKIVVSAIDPVAAMGMIENEKLRQTASQVAHKLIKVMESL